MGRKLQPGDRIKVDMLFDREPPKPEHPGHTARLKIQQLYNDGFSFEEAVEQAGISTRQAFAWAFNIEAFREQLERTAENRDDQAFLRKLAHEVKWRQDAKAAGTYKG